MSSIGKIGVLIIASLFLSVVGTVYASDATATPYVGAEKCKDCHKLVYESWNKTKHASAYSAMEHAYNMLIETGRGTASWIEIGRSKEWCEQCHTTGRQNGKYVLKNVQCERCHLAGKEHVEAGGGKATQEVNWKAELCSQCHGGSQHPQYDDWKQSAHSESLTAAGGAVAKAAVCQECHVAQAAVDSDFGSIKIELVDDPEPINCQTCHDPHGSGNFRELRYPPDELCAKCHNVRGPQIAGHIAHTQANMFNGSIMEEAGVTCYNCHMYVKVYESEISPRVTGHTFEQRREQCVSSCHPGKDIKWAENAVKVRQTEIGTLLSHAEEKIEIVNEVISKRYPSWNGKKESVKGLSAHGSTAIDKYIQARYNIDFVKADKSMGMHNGEKAKAMLEEAILLSDESLESISREIAAPIPEVGRGTNLPKIVFILVIVGILLAGIFEIYAKFLRK